jgi:hypothetical protein
MFCTNRSSLSFSLFLALILSFSYSIYYCRSFRRSLFLSLAFIVSTLCFRLARYFALILYRSVSVSLVRCLSRTCAAVGDAGGNVVPGGRLSRRPRAAARQTHRHEEPNTRGTVSLNNLDTV